jgi:hypothetical protein
MTPSLQATSDAGSVEPFAGPLKAALIWPGAIGISVGLHWWSFVFRPLPHNNMLNGIELVAIVVIAILEAVLVPVAIFKLLRQPEFRNWRNVVVTLVAIVGALPGALLLIGAWIFAGGDWA